MGGKSLAAYEVTAQAVTLAKRHYTDDADPAWRTAATLSDAYPAILVYFLCVLCAALHHAQRLIPVAVGDAARTHGSNYDFFRIQALFLSARGRPMTDLNQFRAIGVGM